MKAFNDRLQECLAERSWSQSDLARASGITRASISRYVKDDRQPNMKQAVAIADALMVSLDWLFGREEYTT